MPSFSLGAAARPAPPPGAYGPSPAGHVRAIEAARGQPLSVTYDVIGAEALGADWLSLFSEYVEEHKRYPPHAAENDQDGTNQVSIVVRRDGRVTGLDLERGSGVGELDAETQSLFRGHALPPFPPETKDDEVTIVFTMHYVIVQ